METKLCRKCSTIKPHSEFVKTTWTKTGVTANCKLCRSAYQKQRREKNYEAVRQTEINNHKKNRLRNNYGITNEDYELMLSQQNNSCAICGKHKDSFKIALAVDHDHATGNVRGLLCSKCNVGLGHFNDEVGLLEKAILYLKEKYS